MRILQVSPVLRLKHGMDTYDVGLAHCYLAGYVLRNAAFPVEFRIVTKEAEKAIDEFAPDIVAVSGMTYNFNETANVASAARQYGAKVIVGGHHISVLPQQLTEDMDVGVLSEGEETFMELIHLAHQGKWGPEYWRHVRGVVFRTPTDDHFVTPPRPLIRDLDAVGHPVRELAPRTPTILEAVVTSRGCPYDCIFCYETRFWQNKVRFHSPEYVIREIENVHRLSGCDRLRIDDSLFLLSKPRLAQLVEQWERHPLRGRVTFSCSARSNKIDQEMAELAQRLGITSVFFGFESNSSEVLSYLKVRGVTPDDNQRAYDVLTRLNISVEGSIIIGAPDETREQMMDTYDFIKRNPLMRVTEVSHLVPLPGTPVWQYAMERGLVSEEMDFSRLGGQRTDSESIFLSETLGREQMIEVLRKFRRLMHRRRLSSRWRRRFSYVRQDPFSIPTRTLRYVDRKRLRLRAAN